MKKRQKKIAALLLAGMMMCLPASQVLAETAYDAGAGISGQLIFPNDSLVNIASGAVLDGQEAALGDGGIWKNEEKGIVYRAETDEAGLVQITKEGYTLEVVGGVSSKNDSSKETPDHHYEYPEGEEPEITTDIACYQQDETVKLIAEEPEEGMVFSGWTSETEGVVFADSTAPETTITMLDKEVKVTANYVPAPETEAPVVEEPTGEEPAEEVPAVEEPAVEEPSGEESAVEEPVVQDPSEETPVSGEVVEIQAEPVAEEVIPAEYMVTVNNGTESGFYTEGTQVTVMANDRTAEGLAFSYWEVTNAALDNVNAEMATFVMPAAEVVLTAQYTEIVEQTTAFEVIVNDGTGETVALESETVESTQSDTLASEQSETVESTQSETVVPEQSETVESSQSDTPASEQSETVEPTQSEPQQSEESEVIQVESSEVIEEESTQEEAPQTFSLSVENGIGSGEYEAGETVTVEASEAEGMVFQGWEVSTASVLMTDPSESVAAFTMPPEDVTVTAVNTEATFQAEIINGTFEDGTSEPKSCTVGETVKIKAAAPAEGYLFSHWEGTATVDNTPVPVNFADASQSETTFTAAEGTSSVTVTAVYKAAEKYYTITVANGLIDGVSSEKTLKEDTEFTITPNEAPYGQSFSHWEINDGAVDLGEGASSEMLTLTATENMKILAIYEGIEYSVTVTDGYSDYDSCVVGTVVTVTADEAPEGYEFDYWYVETENAALADAYSEETTFTMPDGAVDLTAYYKQVEFQVTVENGYADQDYYYAGDTVTVYSNYPASGREFNQWAAVSGNVTFKDSGRWKTTFTMPASNVVAKATYKNGPSTDDNLILDIIAGGDYYKGDTIQFSASGAGMSNSNPNPGDYRYRPSGYQIGNVTGTWQSSPYTTKMAINANGEYTLKVIFNKDIFDGSNWVSDGTSDAKSLSFRVVDKAAGVATGDNTPIFMVAAIAVISCVIFVILLIMFMKKGKSRRR